MGLSVNSQSAPSYGELYIHQNVAVTTLTLQNTYYPITTNWNASNFNNTTLLPLTGRLECLTSGTYQILCTSTHTNTAGSSRQFEFAISLDGNIIVKSTQLHTSQGVGTTDSISINCLLDIAVGQYIDFEVRCTSHAGTNITITDANFNIVKIA